MGGQLWWTGVCSVPAALCRAGPQASSLLGCAAVAKHVSQIFLHWWEPDETWGYLLLSLMSSGSLGSCGPVFSIRVLFLHVPRGKSHQCGRDTGIHYEMTVTTSGNKQESRWASRDQKSRISMNILNNWMCGKNKGRKEKMLKAWDSLWAELP